MLLLLLTGYGASGPLPPADPEPLADIYYYDRDMPIGDTADGEQLPPETIYD